jgi:uncharacterized protein YjbI with pentapeptide repeats
LLLQDNKVFIDLIHKGVKEWNKWRHDNPTVKPDLSNTDLSDMNLSGINFDEVNLEGSEFFQTDLSNSNMKMANLSKSEFSGAHFEKASLYKANFSKSSLIQVNFENSDLRNVQFSDSDMRGCNFLSADLRETDFKSCNLLEANFSKANLSFADVSDADLSHANFNETNLRGLAFGNYKSMHGKYLGIHGLDSSFGNALFVRDAMDQDYLDTLKQSIEETPNSFSKKTKQIGFFLWSLFDYGRSLLKVCFFALLIALGFATVYYFDMYLNLGIIDYSSSAQSWFTPFYYSIVTYSTLGFGDITPSHWFGEIVVVIEVILGYVTLGLLLSILANKVARRS